MLDPTPAIIGLDARAEFLDIKLGLGVVLMGLALYYRKAIKAASVVGSVTSRLVWAGVILGVLLVTEIIPGINVERAFSLVATVIEWVWRLGAEVAVSWL